MKSLPTVFLSLAALTFATTGAPAAEVDARPSDKLMISGSAARQVDVDDGGGGSLNWLHYFTPGAIIGVGAEHQFIADARLNFGSVRASVSRGAPGSQSSIFGEMNYGEGDDDGRAFDYSVAVLGVSHALSQKFYVEVESRQIDIDTSHGNLPKLGLTYVWTPRLLTYVAYAHSVGGNLGTELASARIEYYWPALNLKFGGSAGRADPSVLVLQPGITAPAVSSKQGFVGVGRTFKRGEVQLIGDYLKTGAAEKITVTVSYTAYIGSRGRNR